MTTLYKRATPSQAMMLRMVEGAIKNACDAHGEEFSARFARSVAKRAVGTLSAEWPAVLGAKPSAKQGVVTYATAPAGQLSNRCRGAGPHISNGDGNGGVPGSKGPSFRRIDKLIRQQLWWVKKINDPLFLALVESLREIDRWEKLDDPRPAGRGEIDKWEGLDKEAPGAGPAPGIPGDLPQAALRAGVGVEAGLEQHQGQGALLPVGQAGG